MRCPSCQHPAFEAAPACPGCGLSLATADRQFGVPPVLSPGIADLARVFSPRDRKRLAAAIAKLERRFPQVRFTVLAVALPVSAPLGVYAFWVFNRSGICPDIEKGGANHSVLLTVDPQNCRANITVGYGLEPFVGESHLLTALGAGGEAFAAGDFTGGAAAVIQGTAEVFERVATALDRTYGIRIAEVYEQEVGKN